MRVIAIIGQKGGTGKTTLSCTLAVSAVIDGTTTVAIDMDPQVSLCEWSDTRELDTPVVIDCQPARLEKTLIAASDNGAELCIIDTAGRAEISALKAAKAADLVLVPMQPSILDIRKVAAALDIVRLAGNQPTMVVMTRVRSQPRRTAAGIWLAENGIKVCPHVMGERVSYQDACAAGKSPQEHEPRSKAAAECAHIYKSIIDQVGK